ncbi:MAG: DinB family protein [Bacteroidota bacterium]
MQIPQNEYHPFYHNYVSKVPDGDIIDLLISQTSDTLALYQSIPHDQWNHGYAPGKWSIKELLVHLMDSERVFTYRALRIARGDETPLPGFEQDDYIPTSEANLRTVEDLLEEYQSLRASTISLIKSFNPTMLVRTGTASGGTVSVRALCAILTGHELHHCGIIKERYLKR